MAKINPFTGDLLPDDEVTAEDLEAAQDNIVNLGFRTTINGDYSEFSMTGKTVDEYNDESGIDTDDSINATYDTVNKLYQPASELDSFTKLMLHFNGPDESTTITDSSQSAHTVTANGDAQLDTDYKKFGTASCFLDGTGDYLSLLDSTDWDFTGDFTIDFQVRMEALGIHQVLYHQGAGTNTNEVVLVYINPDQIEFIVWSGGDLIVDETYAWNIDIDVWHHLEICRHNNDLILFRDGNIVATRDIGAVTFPSINHTARIGANALDAAPFHGHLDEFRISNGIARHTTSFTPPTSEYSGDLSNMTLISEAHSVDTPPSTIRLAIREEDVDSITLNTDLLADVSRDDGTTWETITLGVDNQFDTNSRILTGSGDVSGQPSGTDLRYKLRTANTKDLKIHGTARLWD